MDGGKADRRVEAVRRALWWALVTLVVLLAVTGIHLLVAYEPRPAQAWPALDGVRSGTTLADRSRDVHRLAAWAALPVGVALGATSVIAAARRRPHGAAPGGPGGGLGVASVAGIGLVGVLLGAALTGLLLPWDQVALEAVTVGTGIRGYRWLQDDGIAFVLVRGAEMAPSTLRAWLLVHGGLAIAAAGLVVVLRRRWQRSS